METPSPNPTGRYYLKIERPVYQISDVNTTAKRNGASVNTLFDEIMDDTTYKCRVRRVILGVLPSITWLSNYNWRADLVKDVIAGCTVAIMNIPQGMAYAMLANVPPVVGIYMAFFPVLVYAFLGTSRHVSMGSFAVVCLMTGKIVQEYSTPQYEINNLSSTLNSTESVEIYTPIQVATAVSLTVGLFQILMYVCRLGVICSLLSDTLVSGFTAGAAMHVFTSQIKDIFGFQISSHSGMFQNVFTYLEIFKRLDTINYVATLVSVITILILVFNNSFLKPWVSKRCVFPVPIELIVVLIGTIVSKYSSITSSHGLKVVGHISVGIPHPKPPTISLVSSVAMESLVIAVIAYIISMSMALIFAQRNKYEVDPNQELLAQGAGNVVGSFFSCGPFAASLSRSVIQEAVGGKTQLASLVSCSILLFVLLWIGPFFEPLPRCVLSSLIVVALKSVLLQVVELPSIWRLSFLDAMVWISTYLTVILIEIDVGLLVGLLVSVLSLFIQGLKPQTYLLSRVPGTDIYVDKSKYNHTVDPQGGKIIRYCGGINFANRGHFKNRVLKLLNIDPKRFECKPTNNPDTNKVFALESIEKIRYLILDLSGIHYIDPAGAHAIRNLAEELRDLNIQFYAAGTCEPLYETFKTNGLMESNLFYFFPTVHDAYLYAQYTLSISTITQ